MNNPFAFGIVVEGESFCNRVTELDDMLKYCRNSQNVLIYSHRRTGKTSLMHQVFNVLEKENPSVKKIHVDLYGVLTEQQFVSNIFKSLNQIESKVEKLVEFSKNVFRTIKLNFSFDPVTGTPTMTPSFQPDDKENVLEEVMMVIEGYSKKDKVVVVFDEFQEIENFKDDTFEKRLRKIIQRHQNICYVFMGSKRHILTQMFNSKDRAFYKSSEHYPLHDIESKHYIAWIKELFLKYDKSAPSKPMIENVVDLCNNRPMHVQQFFYYLWDEDVITDETIKKTENRIISQHQDEFLNLWDSLTLNQRKTLNLIIVSNGKNVFYADVIQGAGLKSSSQVKKSIEVLTRRDIIQNNGHYKVQDIMFEKWIQRLM